MNLRWKIAQAAEIRWWEYYLKDKDAKIYLRQKCQYWRRVLKELDFPLGTREQILDAGCGPAGIFLILESQQVDALDPLLSKYEAKISHFTKSQFPWVTFHDQSLEQFQSNQSYDKIFCLNAINHVSDLSLSLNNLFNNLKPGGDLLITVDTHNSSFFKKLFQLLPGDILHPHQFSLTDYKEMINFPHASIFKTQRLKKGLLFDYWAIWVKKETA